MTQYERKDFLVNKNIDKNDLAYWFPILAATGVKVPRTEILKTDFNLLILLDGKRPNGFADFLESLGAAARRVGSYPIFLRSGHVSGKHEWKNTCFVEKEDDLLQHVVNIIEYGEIASFIGLPVQTWAVREFLPLRHKFTAFNGMPVANERRFFFRDGKVVCHHPYWPIDSIRNPSCDHWQEILKDMSRGGDGSYIHLMTEMECVTKAFDGYWSLDWAQHDDGSWYAIDMALGDDSYHWAGCPNEPADQKKARLEREQPNDQLGMALMDLIDQSHE